MVICQQTLSPTPFIALHNWWKSIVTRGNVFESIAESFPTPVFCEVGCTGQQQVTMVVDLCEVGCTGQQRIIVEQQCSRHNSGFLWKCQKNNCPLFKRPLKVLLKASQHQYCLWENHPHLSIDRHCMVINSLFSQAVMIASAKNVSNIAIFYSFHH